MANAKIQVSMAKPQWIAKKLRDEIRVITRGVPMRWEPIDKPNPLHMDVTTEAFDRAVSTRTTKDWMLGAAHRAYRSG